ncbi:MAG TPA: ABC transporter substrate-binding protein [Caulobacteraceae bacterium]|jgi:NitT/TauT family transport system substrate-binding protein
MDRRTLLGLLPAAAAVAACSHKARPDIRFATDWRAQAEHGGFYQALATGEYSKRGLTVEIVQGGPNASVAQLIASGAIEMGIGSDGFTVFTLANEKAPVKAVAAFFQKNPQVIIAHDDPAIKTLADLKGHPILIAAEARDTFWPWLKAKYGFTDDQVRSYNNSDAPFLVDQRAAQEGYLTSEPYTIEKATGVKPKVFLLADEGYMSYACMALAPDRLMKGKPQMVQAFIDASAAGWKSYLNGDPTPANRLILRDNKEMTQDLIDQARQKMSAYGIVEGGDAKTQGVGVMTNARWADFFTATTQQGLFPKSLDYRSAYTLQFLPRVKA